MSSSSAIDGCPCGASSCPRCWARTELLAMAAEDRAVREQLLAAGELADGYHPRMEAVHVGNAARLMAILDRIGWPGRHAVGEQAGYAAWLVLQHSIGDPPLRRRGLALVEAAADRGELDRTLVATLADRICVLEGRPQRHGTQFEWDAAGELNPSPIDDPERVDARRRQLGMEPLADHTARMRARAVAEGETPPKDYAAWRANSEAWLRRVGWR